MARVWHAVEGMSRVLYACTYARALALPAPAPTALNHGSGPAWVLARGACTPAHPGRARFRVGSRGPGGGSPLVPPVPDRVRCLCGRFAGLCRWAADRARDRASARSPRRAASRRDGACAVVLISYSSTRQFALQNLKHLLLPRSLRHRTKTLIFI